LIGGLLSFFILSEKHIFIFRRLNPARAAYSPHPFPLLLCSCPDIPKWYFHRSDFGIIGLSNIEKGTMNLQNPFKHLPNKRKIKKAGDYHRP
jgi:hypothetical protein